MNKRFFSVNLNGSARIEIVFKIRTADNMCFFMLVYFHYYLLFLTNMNKSKEHIVRVKANKNVASGDILSHIIPAINPPGRATRPIAV